MSASVTLKQQKRQADIGQHLRAESAYGRAHREREHRDAQKVYGEKRQGLLQLPAHIKDADRDTQPQLHGGQPHGYALPGSILPFMPHAQAVQAEHNKGEHQDVEDHIQP